MHNTENKQYKSSNVYVCIILFWLLTEIFGGIPLIIHAIHIWELADYFGSTLLVVNFIFISYFWLNGFKDIVYVAFYYHRNPRRLLRENNIENNGIYKSIIRKRLPRVALVYTTCDDFIPDSLKRSMNQDYPNTKVYILDDSRSASYKNSVDKFAKKYEISVIRRKIHKGFKAGNLNHFLCNDNSWDYFVLLDSDEIIPRNFVTKALPFFYWDKNLGILQCNHISTRNTNKFMKSFYRGANAHWPTYQSVKEHFGFLSLLGHGAMISRKCFNNVGQFPLMVAEDLSFTIEAAIHKWDVRFAETIVCQEQFPVDYEAFKKRQLKWTGGNMQFTKRYTRIIFLGHNFPWYQKLDILLFVYSLPLMFAFSLFLLLNLVVLPIMNITPDYLFWLIIPTILFLFSPALNDMIYNHQTHLSLVKQITYQIKAMFLYSSMYYISLYGVVKCFLGGKAKFIVTPKKISKYSWLDCIRLNIQNIVFALVLCIISWSSDYSLAPVMLFVVPGLACVYLTRLSNKNK